MESGRSGIVKTELFIHAGRMSSNFLILLMTYYLRRFGLMARYPNLLLFPLFLFPLVFLLIIHYIWFGRENCIKNTAIKLTNQVCYSSYSFSLLRYRFCVCSFAYDRAHTKAYRGTNYNLWCLIPLIQNSEVSRITHDMLFYKRMYPTVCFSSLFSPSFLFLLCYVAYF